MSARIPDTLLVSEVLKPTGFDCPEDLEGVSFNEAVSGGNSYNFYYWEEDAHTGYFTLSEKPQVGDNAYPIDDSGSPDGSSSPLKIISVSATSIDVGDNTASRKENKDIIFTKS